MRGAAPARLALALAVCAVLVPAWNSPGTGTASAQTGTNAPEEKRVRLTGRVVDNVTGEPLRGATVTLSQMVIHGTCFGCGPLPPPPKTNPPRSVVTGSDGTFAFDDVPEHNINIHATKPGYMDAWPIRRHAEDSLGNVSPIDEAAPLVIRLAPGATITGVLRHHDGTPVTREPEIALMRMHMWSGWPRLEFGGWPKYAGDGSYVFDDLAPGHYYLVANPDFNRETPERMEAGRAFGEAPVHYPAPTNEDPRPFFTLREGEHRRVDLELPEKVLHRVTASGNPGTLLGPNITDGNGGIYRFHELYPQQKVEAWLPRGTYRLDNGRVGEISGPMPFEIADADLLDLHFSFAETESVRVTLPIEASFAPTKFTGGGSEANGCASSVLYMVRTDYEGYIEVVDSPFINAGSDCPVSNPPISVSLVPGSYTVALMATNNTYAKTVSSGAEDLALGPLVVEPGETPQPLRIVFAEGARVQGKVHANGKPVPAWIYALPDDIATGTHFRLFNPVFSQDDGEYRLSGLAPGSYYVFASDVELRLNVHDPNETAYWRTHGKLVRVGAGETTNLDLEVVDPPDEAAGAFD
jgi:Carboxypeptidase regulatory-like domain